MQVYNICWYKGISEDRVMLEDISVMMLETNYQILLRRHRIVKINFKMAGFLEIKYRCCTSTI